MSPPFPGPGSRFPRFSVLRPLVAGCIIATGAAAGAAAQDSGPTEGRSTRSGVYSASQAERGGELYALACVSCHTGVTHTGPAFVAKWNGRPLSDLYGYMRENMPKSDPGSLSPEEYTLALAYMLKLNGMPAGPEALPADSLALRKIRIEFKATAEPSRSR